MYHVVICTEAYQAPFGTVDATIYKKGEVYQAEQHGQEYRVWRSKVSFLKFSARRFQRYFRIFC